MTLELYERTLCLMLELQRRLLRDPRPQVARYAAELPQWIPATVHFTATSARYWETASRQAGKPLDLPSLSLTQTPTVWDAADLTPPPYPQIAWWWNQLR